MIKRLYNYMLLPEIPELAKAYYFHIVTDGALWACNNILDSQSAHLIIPDDGCHYGLREDGNAWTLVETYSGMAGTGFNYLYQNPDDIWVSCDIQNLNGETVFRTSDRGFVEYGWSDGGEDGNLSILQFTVPQGFHIAGKWRCIVSGTDSAVASFKWYKNGALIDTETGKTQTECIPTSDNIGSFTYECVITFENGKSVTAGPMTMVVEAYDPGEDPGGGGDPDPGGGGGGGGGDETSLITGIDLNVYPDTVVPGGHATIEVTVNGIGNYSKAFTARLSGQASPETELFSAGYSCNVWIAEEETAEYVFVTVASVQDPTVTATEMIYIDHNGTEDEGTTQEQIQRAFWKGFAAARAYFREAKVSISAASINIAKDAEPTTKEGKLRRSFWQGFVSALVVETVPDCVLVSSDGYMLRDSSGRYLCAKKPPVAFLYNGVRLPPLPEWDEEAYPYAYISGNPDAAAPNFSLAVSPLPWRCKYVGSGGCGYVDLPDGESITYYSSSLEEGQWADFRYFYMSNKTGRNYVFWSNQKIYNMTDDSLYLEDSDPVPVYE